MTDENWPPEVIDFYRDLSLGPGARESILQVRQSYLETRKWKRVAGGLAAGCCVVVAFAVYSFVQQGAQRKGKNVTVFSQPRAYRLVAVRIHNNACGKCKKMGNVFAELQRDLDGRRVLFLTFDVSDSVTKSQSLLLGETLKIREALDGIATGNIVLLDRHGQLLTKLDGTAGRRYLANQIAMRL